ncbi:MAG: hypothetical protein AAF297_00235 [Planctomycetota bacterium]
MTKMRWSLVAVLALVALVGCNRAPSSSTPGEQAGNPPGGDDRAGAVRLAVLSPALAATLDELGLGDLVVAKHDYDLVLGDDVPAFGHNEAIDYERLLAVEPTHVLLEQRRQGVPGRLSELAEDRGWVVRTHALRTIDDVAAVSDDLALSFGAASFDARSEPGPSGVPGMPAFGDPSERFGRELPSADLARAMRPVEGAASIGPVLLLASVDPPAAVGPGSFHHDILVRMGATPAISEGSAWMELDAEDVLRLAPAAVVLIEPRGIDASPGEVGAAATRARLGSLGELPVPAVVDGKLATIDDPLALLPSLSMVGFAEDLRVVVERWQE